MTPRSALSRALGGMIWLGFFAIILAAWAVLWRMAAMAGLDPLGRPVAAPMMPMTGLGTLVAMWALMMAAMMLPTLVPTLRTYEGLIRPGVGSRAGWLGVLAGFFAVWVGFAVTIAAVQAALMQAGWLGAFGAVGSRAAAAALLIAAGLWQFTRAKAVCHGVCHSPMGWFLAKWRAGFAGGARMGTGLGAYCVGCCWTYMALGFVGGTMNLAWMGLATLVMVLEKLPEIGRLVLRPAGALMIAGGVAWGVF